jgi:putative PIG3 family NAD(P)H quinone oxidoreductase
MKAAVITNSGAPDVLAIRDIPEPQPAPEELLVKVHATALNRADLLQRLGRYPAPKGTRDDIPGLEFAGDVMAIGAKVAAFKIGDPVMGLLQGEGYAEQIVTHERLAMPIPTNLSFVEAAAIPEVFLTAYDALFARLNLRMGERLLIHAIGSGVGIAALQLAKTTGAEVFGTTGSEEKIRMAEALGLDVGIPYRSQDFAQIVAERTGGKGVHAILDFVGASYWSKNLDCLARQGRMVLVGTLGGSKVEADLGLIMRKRLQITGTVLRARPLEEKIALTKSFEERALPLFAAGKLKPVVDSTFSLEQVGDAHAYMETNQNFGKIVLKIV